MRNIISEVTGLMLFYRHGWAYTNVTALIEVYWHNNLSGMSHYYVHEFLDESEVQYIVGLILGFTGMVIDKHCDLGLDL